MLGMALGFVLLLLQAASSAVVRDTCILTDEKPAKPLGLSFCTKYSDRACCAPPHDAEIEELFNMLTDVGDSCRLRGDIRDHPMAVFYCLPCDPGLPNYIPEGKKEIQLCSDWVEESFGSGTNKFKTHHLDECGLLVSSPCLGADGTLIPERDRYTCGDDLLFPHQNLSFGEFFNHPDLGPPGLDDYKFVIIGNRSVGNCFSAAQVNYHSGTVVLVLISCLSFFNCVI